MIVPVFPSRILSVSYGKHFVWVGVIGPPNATDFVLPHGGRNRKPNDAPERNFLSGVCVAGRDKSIELILCRTSVTLVTFSNKAKTRERYASETDAIRRYGDPVDCRRMGHDCFDVPEIHSKGDGACALAGTLFSKFNQTFAIELREL